MKKLLKLALGCIFALLVVSEASAAGAGAYSSTALGPNIYSKGWWNIVTFNPIGPIPPGSKIGAWVKWNHSMSYRPTGFIAYLCWDSTLNECINITNMPSGSTSVFNGRTPNHSLVMAQAVIGSGTLSPPVYGNMNQIIVNFTYP